MALTFFFFTDKAEALGNYRICWRSQRCLGLCDPKVHAFSTVLPLRVSSLLIFTKPESSEGHKQNRFLDLSGAVCLGDLR